jgi:hypothetical protein
MDKIQPYAKAVVVGLATGLYALQAALTDGVSSEEWIGIALAVLASIGVWAVPNRPKG